MNEPVSTVQQVIGRLQAIDAELSPEDGAAVFNRMYLTVTEQVAARLQTPGLFRHPDFMTQLDVAFAAMWLAAYDSAAAGSQVPKAWAPLFEGRHEAALLPIQFALAGMNAHIENDLPLAVVDTCRAAGVDLNDPDVHADYQAINRVLADVEAEMRHSFLTGVAAQLDAALEPVVHLVSCWDVEKARDAAWITAEAVWVLGNLPPLAHRYEDALARSVGLASRCLLAPCRVAR